MTSKMEAPARLADATGAKSKAANFLDREYPHEGVAATLPFAAGGTAVLRVAHLASRYGLTIERAAMVAPLIFGEAAHG